MITFKQFFTETGELGCLIRGLKVLNFLVGDSNSGIHLYWNWIKWTRKKKKRKCIFNFCKSTKVLVGNLVPSSDGIFTLLIKVLIYPFFSADFGEASALFDPCLDMEFFKCPGTLVSGFHCIDIVCIFHTRMYGRTMELWRWENDSR